MKKVIISIIVFTLVCVGFSLAQDALTMHDLNHDAAAYNSAFIAEVGNPLNAMVTTSLGGNVQNTSKVNLLAYANFEKPGFGVGLKLNSKFYGLFNTNTIEFLYAKRLQVNTDQAIYLGLNFGMHTSALDMGRLNVYVNFEDPFLMENELPQQRLTAGLGMVYTYKNNTKFGLSLPSFVKNKNDFFPVYVMNLSHEIQPVMAVDYKITPLVMVYGSPLEAATMDASLQVTYQDSFWLRGGVRSTKGVIFGLGWQQKVISIGYTYNASWGLYTEVNPGVHSLNVIYRSKPKKM